MNTLLAISLTLLSTAPAPPARKNSCEYCHSQAKTDFYASAHRREPLGCVGCHGGDATKFNQKEAHDTSKGWKGRLKGRAVVEACARCHSDVKRMRAYRLRADQLFEYKAGAHAKSVLRPGKPGSATCVDCHHAHRVLPSRDSSSTTYRLNIAKTCARCHADPKLMKSHGLPSDTYDKYERGIHGQLATRDGNLKVPTCHDCHGNHGVTAARAKQVAFVCGNCHRVTRNQFLQSPHFKAFGGRKLGECTTCHGHHEVTLPTVADMLGKKRGSCLQAGCHEAGNAKDRGARVAEELHRLITTYNKNLQSTERRLATAEANGFEVATPRGHLRDAKRVRERLGPLLHAADVKRIQKELDRGRGNLKEALETLAVKQRARRDRRIVSVAVLLAMAILFLLLLFKYRRLVRKPERRS